jgi:polysaccharide biosynthesis transport protein
MSKFFEALTRSAGREPLLPGQYLTSGEHSSLAARRIGIQPPREGGGEEWLRALRALRRHWRWSLAIAVALPLTVAITVLLLINPVYEPTARIEAVPPGNELFSLDPAVRFDSTFYQETQAKSLQTDELAIAVIRKLHLDQNPEFVQAHSGVSRLLRRWFADFGRPGRKDLNVGELELTPAEREALKTFQSRLQVQRDTSSWLINISFGAHDPRLAALVTNAIVEQFVDTNYRTQHDAIVQGTAWLSHQLDDIRERMEQSSRALADFQKNTGIMATGMSAIGGAQSTFDQKMLELNHQIMVAQGDRVQLEALLQKVSPENTSALPQAKSDIVVQEIERKLTSAQVELRQALVTYGKNHPKVKELQAEIGELQEQLKEQQNTIFSNLKTAYAAAHTRENLLNSELKVASKELGKLVEYEALKREAQATEALYSALYMKIKEAGIAAESKPSNIRWLDRARVLDFPNRPRRMLDIALGMLAGILAGILVAFVREGLDSKVHTLEDVESLTGSTTISLMPKIDAVRRKLKAVPLWRLAAHKGNGALPQKFLIQRPTSAESEALRGLFTSIRLAHPFRPPQVLLIASALPSEGKTTIAVNLSATLARQGFKTCIVDADLRKALLAGIFGLESSLGLSEVLQKSCTLHSALVPAPGVANLTLLPGLVSQNAGELICSEAMRYVLRQLRAEFQFIIVDSPPILPYADGRAIAAFADGVILVGRLGVSTRQAMKRCLELLEQVRSAPVLDVVLNGVDFSSQEYRLYDYARG